jgi:Fe-S cluster assembly protein SufB
VQNWYPGDENGKGGIYNFVTKRADCRGDRSKVMWTQVETGSAITWKYPSCILRGDDSQGEFYSIAVVNNYQQADTGTKMIHLGKNTSSRIVSKGISPASAEHLSRARLDAHRKAKNSRNYTQCDSLLIGTLRRAHGALHRGQEQPRPQFEHEATTSKISDDQLFYCRPRHGRGRGRGADRQRLLQGSAAGAADGIRRGSAAADGDLARRVGRVTGGPAIRSRMWRHA